MKRPRLVSDCGSNLQSSSPLLHSHDCLVLQPSASSHTHHPVDHDRAHVIRPGRRAGSAEFGPTRVRGMDDQRGNEVEPGVHGDTTVSKLSPKMLKSLRNRLR